MPSLACPPRKSETVRTLRRLGLRVVSHSAFGASHARACRNHLGQTTFITLIADTRHEITSDETTFITLTSDTRHAPAHDCSQQP